jgi:hypothetical protein
MYKIYTLILKKMDFEFILDSDNDINENIINTDINENAIIDDEKDLSKIDLYILLMNILGLNIKITYPINMITNTICESYMILNNLGRPIYSTSRCYEFKTDEVSAKIKEILQLPSDKLSLKGISIKVKRIYRHYKYNLIVKDDNGPKNQTIIGFNYKYSGWNFAK